VVYAEDKNSSNSWTLTDRKTSGRAKYDYFLTKKTYLFANTSGDADEAASLDLRFTLGAGVGHQFVDNARWKFAAERACRTSTRTTTARPTTRTTSPARIAANTGYEHDKTWSFAHTLEAYPSLEDADDFYGRSDLRVKLTFTESMLAQLQWIVDYDNTPAAGNDRVDNRYLLSVGWKF
jgi:putative salt-induced outer membrane protein YdiY